MNFLLEALKITRAGVDAAAHYQVEREYKTGKRGGKAAPSGEDCTPCAAHARVLEIQKAMGGGGK